MCKRAADRYPCLRNGAVLLECQCANGDHRWQTVFSKIKHWAIVTQEKGVMVTHDHQKLVSANFGLTVRKRGPTMRAITLTIRARRVTMRAK